MSEQTNQCPYCAETIKADAIICRFCNRDLVKGSTPIKTANVQKPPKKKSKRNIIIAVIASVVMVCCVLSVVALGTDTDESASSLPDSTNGDSVSSEDTLAETPPTATPPPLAPPIEEILATVEGMTDAQRNNYNEQLKGSIVKNWVGTIKDVDEKELFGVFIVLVDMKGGNFLSEVQIEVTEEVALSLNKGQKIVFSGEIESVLDFFGTTVFIENATIEPTE